jgi:putative component of membrane protein insertase Oxa1/YidC/SpoIIIJ protein YidD
MSSAERKLRQRTILDRTAVSAIKFYQNNLSPYKGFNCANRVLYGKLSCSEYARHMILGKGLVAAIPLLRQRLVECRSAQKFLESLDTPNVSACGDTHQHHHHHCCG